MAKAKDKDDDRDLSSAGHKLGQLVGDWLEEYFVQPLLKTVADQLNLFLDHRFIARKARDGDKINWADEDENEVDYDFVLEMEGTDEQKGILVAFFESFWRRGKRHSKDKARDDSGKLMPMRDTYPTVRFLGIVAGGDFSGPASELVKSRGIDLFYVPKAKIVGAFETQGLTIDYPDKTAEDKKAALADAFEKGLTPDKKVQVAKTLCDMVGEATLQSYVTRVRAALGALPAELRFISQHRSKPVVFESIADASTFLTDPKFDFSKDITNFIYQITYSDGTEFERTVATLDELRSLHAEIERLAQHVSSLVKKEKATNSSSRRRGATSTDARRSSPRR
jgi:hypothetical protein